MLLECLEENNLIIFVYEYLFDKKRDKKETLSFSKLMIYPLRYEAYLEDVNLGLNTREFEVLLLLASSAGQVAGQVFSKEQLYRTVWKDEPINCENSVMCCISQLRKKIESDPRKPTYIRTVRGIGYKFVAPEV